MRKKTTAEELDGKEINQGEVKGQTTYNPSDGKITFEDGSQAVILTRYEDSKAYLTASLSTMGKAPKKYWKAV